MDRININSYVADFPMYGTLLMVAIFVYAWVSDTVERKEAFTVKKEVPVVIESFYSGPSQIPIVDRAYALE